MKFLVVTITALTIHLTSCAPTTPALDSTGKINTIRPTSKLSQRGAQQFESIKRTKRISTNPTYNAQIKRVAAKLKKAIHMPGANWEFIVFEDPTPNAFALPGGKVGVHSGLFPITKTDGGLATVLGHEIAHITRNHAGSRITQASGIALGGLILDQITKNRGSSQTERAKIAAGYGTLGTLGLALPKSRKDELEADKIGTMYMAKAGYNPNEAIAMWKRFAAYKQSKGNSRTPEFLSTHPKAETRIKALNSFLPSAMQEYHSH